MAQLQVHWSHVQGLGGPTWWYGSIFFHVGLEVINAVLHIQDGNNVAMVFLHDQKKLLITPRLGMCRTCLFFLMALSDNCWLVR